TDQGVMYRRIDQFEQAIANFEQARTVDPSHLPSLYNIGVVYLYDLKEHAKARAAWEEYVRRAPNDSKVGFIQSELTRIAAGNPPAGGQR
ncbi:MAG: tetratricopeptide repeat protein, partial [Planctomycetota bacterium]